MLTGVSGVGGLGPFLLLPVALISARNYPLLHHHTEAATGCSLHQGIMGLCQMQLSLLAGQEEPHALRTKVEAHCTREGHDPAAQQEQPTQFWQILLASRARL